MKLKTITANIVQANALSHGIIDEVIDNSITHRVLLVKVPKTIKEVKENPLWNEFCREQDFEPGTKVIVELTWNQ